MNAPTDPATRRELPAYDDLPVLEPLGHRHAWDVFGAGDQLGTLNLLDEATVTAAAAEVQTGERVGLSLELSALDPPLYGRRPLAHELICASRNIWDDKYDDVYPQASSQWDGFRHVRARELGFYGGVTADPPQMGTHLGIQAFAERGIIGRGVLLDVGAHLRATHPGYDPLAEVSVEATTLREVADAQGVEVRRGDVLCVRFGWLTAYRALSAQQRVAYAEAGTGSQFAGLSAHEATARLLWDWHVAAVACDNPGAEVSPGDPAVGSLHRRLIPTLGVVVGELLDFDALADRCRADGRWSFFFVAVPLNVDGGVGSPANAVAVR